MKGCTSVTSLFVLRCLFLLFLYLISFHFALHLLVELCHVDGGRAHFMMLMKDASGGLRVCRRVSNDRSANCSIINCFSNRTGPTFPMRYPCLNRPTRMRRCLRGRSCMRCLFYYLPSGSERIVISLVSCYRGRLMRFFDIPGIHGCLRRHVSFGVVKGIPCLNLHPSPLD